MASRQVPTELSSGNNTHQTWYNMESDLEMQEGVPHINLHSWEVITDHGKLPELDA